MKNQRFSQMIFMNILMLIFTLIKQSQQKASTKENYKIVKRSRIEPTRNWRYGQV